MPKLVKNGELINDSWTLLEKSDDGYDLSSLDKTTAWLIPLAAWLNTEVSSLPARCGIWLGSDDAISNLSRGCVASVPVIAINFPAFADGRGFSLARQLVEQLESPGEVRGIGQFMQDQMFYLKRCGVNAFQVSDDADIASIRTSLNDFSDTYQAACDEARPLFRRRA